MRANPPPRHVYLTASAATTAEEPTVGGITPTGIARGRPTPAAVVGIAAEHGVTVALVALAAIPVPRVTIPRVTVPCVTVPCVTVPCVTIPRVTVPCVTIPRVTIATVTIAAFTVAAVAGAVATTTSARTRATITVAAKAATVSTAATAAAEATAVATALASTALTSTTTAVAVPVSTAAATEATAIATATTAAAAAVSTATASTATEATGARATGTVVEVAALRARRGRRGISHQGTAGHIDPAHVVDLVNHHGNFLAQAHVFVGQIAHFFVANQAILTARRQLHEHTEVGGAGNLAGDDVSNLGVPGQPVHPAGSPAQSWTGRWNRW